MEKAIRNRGSVRAGWWAYTLLLLLFIFLPPIYLLLISFNEGLLPHIPAWEQVSLKWYARLLQEWRIFEALKRSLVIGGLTAAIATPLAILAALAYRKVSNRGPLMATLVMPIFIPGVIMGIALAMFFRATGWKPSIWTVAVAHVLWSLPFAFIVVLTAFSGLRPSLPEAAQDLGATPWRTFRDVTLPLTRSGVIGAALFAFLLSFNEFIRAYFVSGRDTLSIYMFGAMKAGTSPVIYSLAGSILVVTIVLIVVALFIFGRSGSPVA